MWGALGDTFGLALGLALSPFAITTALILLLGDRGRIRASFFAVGWFVAMYVITLVPLLVTDVADEDDPSGTATGIDILHLGFAALFFLLAALTWIKRPTAGAKAAGKGDAPTRAEVLELEALDLEAPGKKSLFQRLDGIGIWGCLALGLAQGVLIIKNIPLGISAGVQLGSADIGPTQSFLIVAIFAAMASLGALLPLAAAVFGGETVDHSLREARRWIEAHMMPITLVVLLVVGVIFLGEGLGLAD